MKRLLIWPFTVLLLFCLFGCHKTGYRITITTVHLRYSVIQQLESALNKKNFQVASYLNEKGDMAAWRERKVGFPKHPDEVYTYLLKTMGDERYALVQVFLNYVKNADDTVNNLELRVENMYTGFIMLDVKAEIDSIGNLCYQALVDEVGKENVMIERKEVSPPQFY